MIIEIAFDLPDNEHSLRRLEDYLAAWSYAFYVEPPKQEQSLIGLTLKDLKDLIHEFKLPIYGKTCPICDASKDLVGWHDECEICPACHERPLKEVLREVFTGWQNSIKPFQQQVLPEVKSQD